MAMKMALALGLRRWRRASDGEDDASWRIGFGLGVSALIWERCHKRNALGLLYWGGGGAAWLGCCRRVFQGLAVLRPGDCGTAAGTVLVPRSNTTWINSSRTMRCREFNQQRHYDDESLRKVRHCKEEDDVKTV